MIGVIANPSDAEVAREFFELFKTPWEFYRRNGRYEVVLAVGDVSPDATADLVVLYAGQKTEVDAERKIAVRDERGRSCVLSYQGDRIPIYGRSIGFEHADGALLVREDSRECMAFLHRQEEAAFARIGYNLFDEVRRLLTAGQPHAHAHLPTLEMHIAVLRDLITDCGIPLVEIPPVPDGYRFIVCLTHDVDHPSIRQHKLDHTTLGFLARAIFGSLGNLIRGRISLRGVLTNWAAVLKLPFVHLGLAKDFWREFDVRYLEAEKDLPSTFFVIPFKGVPGERLDERARRLRASGYGVKEIAGAIEKLTANGREIGLHGIDAWHDIEKGRRELAEIRSVTRAAELGVRMHWLCFDQQSPTVLENVGVVYDSSVGYNETVGYRAGTTQAYKPLDARKLLELPLHVMDTALFYEDYLGLSAREAKNVFDQMIANAARFGGCLTINWHDRSLAPERLWGACYDDLLEKLKSQGAWFSTAGQAVSWFRKRRSAQFERDETVSGTAYPRVNIVAGGSLPLLLMRTYEANRGGAGARASDRGLESRMTESVESRIPSALRG